MIYKRGKKYFAVFKNNGFRANKELKKNYLRLMTTKPELDPVERVYEDEYGYNGFVIDDRTTAFEFLSTTDARDFILDCIHNGIVQDDFLDWYGDVRPFEFISKDKVIEGINKCNKANKTNISYKRFIELAAVFSLKVNKTGSTTAIYYMKDYKKFLNKPNEFCKEEFEIRRSASHVDPHSFSVSSLNKTFCTIKPIW